MKLKDQVALVTGGGSGIGRAIALRFAREGARVIVNDIRRDAAQKTVDELAPSGGRAIAADVSDSTQVRSMFAEIEQAYGGRLDVLVNNAGGQYFAPAEAIEPKGWRAVMALNVGGTLRMSEACVDGAMREAGGGTIVNVTLSPHHGLTGMVHSSAARAAVEALTRELAERWAGDGVAVVAAAAGHFDTPSLRKYPEQVWSAAARTVPLQRLGRMEEWAWLITLLCSPAGRSLSGSVVTLDGARDNWYGAWPPPALEDDAGRVPTETRKPATWS